MTNINTANINFKWDPKSLEIRTLAVERLLEPLVTQVSVLFRICLQYNALKYSHLNAMLKQSVVSRASVSVVEPCCTS